MGVVQRLYRFRRNFGKVSEIAQMPNLITLQKTSYSDCLQAGVDPSDRRNVGLQRAFLAHFPISSNNGKIELHFDSYQLEDPRNDVSECKARGLTYSAPLKACFRLVVWSDDAQTGERTMRSIKEQVVYMGDMPLMTGNGTFIINGIERVIVSQLHRSPGVIFSRVPNRTATSDRMMYGARIIPYRGSWLDFEFDAKDMLYVRIDRKKKFLASTLLMALKKDDVHGLLVARGLTKEDMLGFYYKSTKVYIMSDVSYIIDFHSEDWDSFVPTEDLCDIETGKIVFPNGKKISQTDINAAVNDGVKKMSISFADLNGRYLSYDYISAKGDVLVAAGVPIDREIMDSIIAAGYKEISVLRINYTTIGPYWRNTVVSDKNTLREEALLEIYKIMRPGELPAIEGAEAILYNAFFNPDRYDLLEVGRFKVNSALNHGVAEDIDVLVNEDIIHSIIELLKRRDGDGEPDDIDSLSNRRVRAVGELFENQFRLGLARLEKFVSTRINSSVDLESLCPNDLINAKSSMSVIREFFSTSQLSQFMEQNNPLSEVAHKRRLSALGPGGLSKDRTVFEARDVHQTHYGRICPIETPEGPNIGLINSLATYARVNRYGFIEAPCRKVREGRVTNEIHYLGAAEESKYNIAQANVDAGKDGLLASDVQVLCRRAGEPVMVGSLSVDFTDVSPKQLVSVAASLIPFLENDDASRALMGSNMQRQAVPLLVTQAPLVGSGMEAIVARDSGALVLARRSGVVEYVDAKRIVIRASDDYSDDHNRADIYNLTKFGRSNHSTCINQRPIVVAGDQVLAGDVIADGPSTDRGELALGRNVLIGFLPWYGYTFEDSIVISSKLVADDVFTSIHIEEFEVIARDTKLGNEEITADIPNIGDELLKSLDESGVVSIGAYIRPGDILVGKITPRGESIATPEEKLLRAIFSEKASDVRDSSLRAPPGVSGTVVNVRILSRRGIEKDRRSSFIEKVNIDACAKDLETEKAVLWQDFKQNVAELIIGQTIEAQQGLLTKEYFENLQYKDIKTLIFHDKEVGVRVQNLFRRFDADIKKLETLFQNKIEKIKYGDDLPPGVLKIVKVFVAVKRKLQPGDKMAGRHGNKGVVSIVVPVEDMPFLEDGTSLDMILNPLGLPSRMNIGQVMETHMGWAVHSLGKCIKAMIEDYDNGSHQVVDNLRSLLRNVYGDNVCLSAVSKQYELDVKNMSDKNLVEAARSLSNGVYIATPVFDGAKETDINKFCELAGINTSGKVLLYDGMTGEPFDCSVTVGYKYVLKLHHLVDEKIHARSIGPYSLVTQQPLGGKAQFGGQRFGEMEVWALEGFGSAYTLQEMLTVKSDDISGRTEAYESVSKGGYYIRSGIPESFNVLTKELKSLNLNIDFLQYTAEEAASEDLPVQEGDSLNVI